AVAAPSPPQWPCSGVPSRAAALVGSATIVGPHAAGHAALYPTGAPSDGSNLNYLPGQVVANAGTRGVDGRGQFTVATSQATHFFFDVDGYYALAPVSPCPVNGLFSSVGTLSLIGDCNIVGDINLSGSAKLTMTGGNLSIRGNVTLNDYSELAVMS